MVSLKVIGSIAEPAQEAGDSGQGIGLRNSERHLDLALASVFRMTL